jgi:hypothetical protein
MIDFVIKLINFATHTPLLAIGALFDHINELYVILSYPTVIVVTRDSRTPAFTGAAVEEQDGYRHRNADEKRPGSGAAPAASVCKAGVGRRADK